MSQTVHTNAEFAVLDEVRGVLDDHRDFVDVEERRRRRLALVRPGDRVEDDGKIVIDEHWGANEGVDDLFRTPDLQLVVVKLLVRKIEDCLVRTVVFRELDVAASNAQGLSQ